jgi:hypothetical protein
VRQSRTLFPSFPRKWESRAFKHLPWAPRSRGRRFWRDSTVFTQAPPRADTGANTKPQIFAISELTAATSFGLCRAVVVLSIGVRIDS